MFNSVLVFLQEHWEVILISCLSILSFVLALIRKKPVWNQVSEMLSSLVIHIPSYINLAESGSLTGFEKKNLVMNLCQDFLISNYRFDKFDEISNLVSELIEGMLSTPQKKKED